MANMTQAASAYQAAAAHRNLRVQEADVFRRASFALKLASDADDTTRARAIADNRRLWLLVMDLLRDPTNALPPPLRASIVSVGMVVQREMERASPDFSFLISINDNIAAGLAGEP
jgi:flagellar protein FlaF